MAARIAGVILAVAAGGVRGRAGESHFETVRSFGFPETSARQPTTTLIEGSDGHLYGATGDKVFRARKDGGGYKVIYPFATGELLEGTDGALYAAIPRSVLKLDRDGSDREVLYEFSNIYGNPHNMTGGFIEGSDGALYGPTDGGTNETGTIIRLNKDGSGFVVLHYFGTHLTASGSRPTGRLLKASDGFLYGVTYFGGGHNDGTIFRLREDGSGFATLWNFGSRTNDGQWPIGGLKEGADGALYGATDVGGGFANQGTIFRINKDGSDYTVLHRFDVFGDDGLRPNGLIVGTDGWLYGATATDGPQNGGTVFRLKTNGGDFEVLHDFSASYYAATNLGWPVGGVIEASDGRLYGATAIGGSAFYGAVYGLEKNGAGFGIAGSFSPSGGDGQQPSSPLVQSRDGWWYGTTQTGGEGGGGTLFKFDPESGDYTILRHFNGMPRNFRRPLGMLALGPDDRLYGLTGVGGSSADYGAIYQVNVDGTDFRVLHEFSGPPADGMNPEAGGLTWASDGRLYGTTLVGGARYAGVLFTLSPDGGDYRILRHFDVTETNAGQYPYGALLEGSDGRLYGATTSYGGVTNRGTIFRINKDGSSYVTLHVFGDNPEDGHIPNAFLIEASDGCLYGATRRGGRSGRGGVFKLGKDGTGFSIVSDNLPGAVPVGGVLEGRDGFLYGVTSSRGPSYDEDDETGLDDVPSLFRLSRHGGEVESLATFSPFDGISDFVALREGRDGRLFGLTMAGGEFGFGSIYSATVSSLARVGIKRFGDLIELRWTSVPDVTYRVQYKRSFAEVSWNDLPGDVTAVGTTAIKSDAAGVENRLYRLRVQP